MLKWGTRIQLVGDYFGSGLDLAGKFSGHNTTDIAVSQALLKGKINLGLSAQSLFDPIKKTILPPETITAINM